MNCSLTLTLCLAVAVFVIFELEGTGGFTIEHATKLGEKLEALLKNPKYDKLPKVKKSLNLYTGVLSYITLKLKQSPSSSIESAVKEFYLQGPPLFMKIPIEDNRLALKKTFKWTDHDFEVFVEELDDAKKVWQEFAREVKPRINDLNENVVNG